MEALREECALQELSRKYEVHSNQPDNGKMSKGYLVVSLTSSRLWKSLRFSVIPDCVRDMEGG